MRGDRLDPRDAAGVLSVLVFAGLAIFASRGCPFAFDEGARVLVQRMRSPVVEPVMFFFAVAGSGYALLALAALAYLVLRGRRHPLAVRVPAITLGALAFVQATKWLVARPRPDRTSFGFPSGHVLGTTLLFGLVVWLAWRSRLPRPWRRLVVVAGSVGVAGVALCRLYFDVHWMSDVVGGFAGGVAWALASTRAVRRRRDANCAR